MDPDTSRAQSSQNNSKHNVQSNMREPCTAGMYYYRLLALQNGVYANIVQLVCTELVVALFIWIPTN